MGTLRPDWPDPAPGRIVSPAAQAAHRSAISAGSGGYVDPESGLFVMTAAYLAERGYCCDNGCRHCPYEPPTVSD